MRDDADALDHRLDLLKMEYSTLRAEIVATSTGRFQFLTLASIMLAVSGAVIGTSAQRAAWVVPTVLAFDVALFLFGAGVFLWVGRIIGALSMRIAEIENQINHMMREAQISSDDLLVWEIRHQARSGLARFYNGGGRRPMR